MNKMSAGRGIAGVLALTLLVGCGSWQLRDGEETDETMTAVAEIAVLSSYRPVDNLIGQFEQANPGIRVVWETIEAEYMMDRVKSGLATGGNHMDVLLLPRKDFTHLADSGQLRELSSLAAAAQFPSDIIETTTKGGRIYGIPLNSSFSVVWYNKDIFHRLALELPGSWEDLLRLCEVLKENAVVPFVVGGKDTWQMTVFADLLFGELLGNDSGWIKRIASGQARWTDPEAIAAFGRLRGLVDRGFVLGGSLGLNYNDAYEAFYHGQAAMIVSGSWMVPSILANAPGFTVGVFAPPGNTAEQPSRIPHAYNDIVAIAATSRHPAEAERWIEYVVQADKDYFIPFNLTARNAHPFESILNPLKSLQQTEMLYELMSNETNKALGHQLQRLLAGEVKPAEAAASVERVQRGQ